MTGNERLIVFNIVEVDGAYNITTEDSRACGYGYFGLPSTAVLATMQGMSEWLHFRKGFDVVFAFHDTCREDEEIGQVEFRKTFEALKQCIKDYQAGDYLI